MSSLQRIQLAISVAIVSLWIAGWAAAVIEFATMAAP